MGRRKRRIKNISNFFKDCKGISEVITTLIIILLSLVAIGIVWVIISNILQSSSEEIEIGQFTINLDIKSVKIQNSDVNVTVKRNKGVGNFTGLNFIFSDGKNSETIRQNETLKELNTKTFTFTLTELNATRLKAVSIAPIFKLESGKEKQGNIANNFEVSNDNFITGAVIEKTNFELYGPVGANLSEYNIQSSPGLLPKFTRVIVDPLDVHLGDNQTFTAYVASDYTITEVTTRTQLDNEILVLPLAEISPGVYSASWKVYDTHTNVYRTNFTAKDSNGNENTVTMSWTDPCTGFSHGSTSTVTQACTISTIDGVDNGNIVLGTGGVITINNEAYLAYTPGYGIQKNGGSIALSSTGYITKQYLFYTDADGDTRASDATYSLSASSSSSGKVRAVSAASTSDCNDGSATYWWNGYGLDNDRDGYGQSSYGCYNGASGSRDATSGTDCLDSYSGVWDYNWCYADSDSDGYGAGSAELVCIGSSCSSAGSYTESGGDCNDGSGSVWQNLNCYLNNDGDGANSASPTSVCSGSSCASGSSSPGNDCCDSDPLTYVGQTNYYRVTNGCGSWDYDCSGSGVGAEQNQKKTCSSATVYSISGVNYDATCGADPYRITSCNSYGATTTTGDYHVPTCGESYCSGSLGATDSGAGCPGGCRATYQYAGPTTCSACSTQACH